MLTSNAAKGLKGLNISSHNHKLHPLAILKKMIQFQICFQLLSGQDDNEMFAGVEFWNADVVGGGKLC